MHGAADELEHAHNSEGSDDGCGKAELLAEVDELQAQVCGDHDDHIEYVPALYKIHVAKADELKDHFHVEDERKM